MEILNNTPLDKLFREFCKNNNFTSMANAVEFFVVFGGTDAKINPDIPLETTLENYILNKYKYLRTDVNNIIKGDESYPAILTGFALGDRRTNSAFRRANISFDKGIELVDDLCDMKILKLEKSQQAFSVLEDQYTVSERLLFTNPFVRFWFGFISPIFQGIRDGNYEEFWTIFNNRKQEFTEMMFEQLSHELMRESLGKDLYKIGRYWDDDITIDLLAQTKQGKIFAGVCKYTNSKMKKSELTQLKKHCKDVKIDIDTFVLFSKSGFSSELKSLKGESLQLFTVKNLNKL